MIFILELFRSIRRYYFQDKLCKNLNIKLYNYLLYNNINYEVSQYNKIDSHWFYQFINSRFNHILSKKIVSVYGVNGDKLAIKINKSDYKIFYTFENVHVKLSPWYIYRDLLLDEKKIDLSLGFDYLNNEKYIRFPYWLITLFQPNDGLTEITNICYKINNEYLNDNKRIKFCSFICRLDYFGDRSYFANEVEQLEKIMYPGAFRHNDNDLKLIFNDNKIEYLKQFKFNLCPENSDDSGYVTEKIFDALKSGCIPIYWGSGSCAEPEILNQDRIIYLKLNEDNTKALEKIKILNENTEEYKKFIQQPIFKENASELIFDYFLRLNNKLQLIFK